MARNWKRDRFGRFAPKNGSNPAPKRKKGKNSKIGKVAVVPYARGSLRSGTVGVNAGTNVSSKARVSFGGYVRLERTQTSKLEKKIAQTHETTVNAIVKKISPNEKMDPAIRSAIRQVSRAQINKRIGGQVRVPGTQSAQARLGTSRYGLPSVVVRKGRSRVSTKDRRSGINEFNDRMKALQEGRKVKKTVRPQRRRKEKRDG